MTDAITMGGGVASKTKPINPSQTTNIIGLSIHWYSISYKSLSQSKISLESLRNIHRLLSHHVSNLIEGVVLELKISDRLLYQGPCYSGGGVLIYTQSGFEKRKNGRPIVLDICGMGCQKLGEEKILKLHHRLMELLSLTEPRPSRVDIALDIVNFPISLKRIKRFSSLLPHPQLSPNLDEPTGVTWGNSKKIELQIYDKALELAVNGKCVTDLYPQLPAGSPLTRIEVRLRRPWLRERGYNDIEQLLSCKSGIMRDIMKYTLRHKGRNGKTSRMWLNFMDQLDQKKPLPEPKLVIPINVMRESLIVCGCLVRLAISLEVQDPYDALTSALIYLKESGKSFERMVKAKKNAFNRS